MLRRTLPVGWSITAHYIQSEDDNTVTTSK